MEDETDELLLMDEDAYDVDPDQLPRRVLTSFAVYNAEVRSSASGPILVGAALYMRICHGDLQTGLHWSLFVAVKEGPETPSDSWEGGCRASCHPWSCCPCGAEWTPTPSCTRRAECWTMLGTGLWARASQRPLVSLLAVHAP